MTTLAPFDTKAIRQTVDLAGLVSHDVELTEPEHGDRYYGPCPFCREGEDRFKVFKNTNLFYCRRCGQKGDAIEYIMLRHGLGFVQATKWLQDTNNVKPAEISPKLQPTKPLEGEALQQWQESAAKLASRAARYLLYVENKEAMGARKWLESRGIGEAEIKDHMLGYNDKWREIVPGYKLPPGLTIPRFNQDLEITAVNVYLDRAARKLTGERRMMAKGSQAKTFFNGQSIPAAKTVIITEGELDAVLLTRFLSPHALIAPITTGGAETIPDDLTILNDKRVFLVLDNDQAGERGRGRWLAAVPHVTVVNVPEGSKDITEFHENTCMLLPWVETWLNPD